MTDPGIIPANSQPLEHLMNSHSLYFMENLQTLSFKYQIFATLIRLVMLYCNDPKFLHRLVWANSADQDQTAPRGAV